MLTAVKIFHFDPAIKVKKVISIFLKSFLKCSLHMAISIGHHACLREMTDQTYPIYALLANFHAPNFMLHFLIAGSKGFESKN